MPAWDASAVARAVAPLRLGLEARHRWAAGARVGHGVGASLEFHDYRAYHPGDDLRHLDWGVLGRTDQLVVRRYRREARSRWEILVDGSQSHAYVPAKMALTCAVADVMASAVHAEGGQPTVWWLGSPAVALGQAWRAGLRAAQAGGSAGIDQPLALAAGSDRVIISDGWCPAGPEAVARRWIAGAGRVTFIEVLTREELAPTMSGAVRLDDVEGGTRELVVDAAVLAARQARMARHRQGWAAALAGRGPGVIPVVVEEGLAGAITALVRRGLLVPRGR